MWLYFEMDDIQFGLYQEGEILDKLYNYWKYSLKNVTIKSKIEDKRVWKIKTVKAEKTYSTIDRNSRNILFSYLSDYDFLELNSFIRELIVKMTLEKGWIWLHASSFKYNDKTYVVAGPKGFGKTTWLIYAVEKMGAKIVVNDQVPTALKDGKLYTFRWRPDVKVSQNTIKMMEMHRPTEADDKESKYMFFPNEMHYSIYDFNGHYKLTSQHVEPYVVDKNIQFVDDYENEIYELIILTDEAKEIILDSESQKMKAVNSFEIDREFVTPRKGSKWHENYNYWNKRFTNIKVSKEAFDTEDKIIKKLCTSIRMIKVNNRMSLDEIERILKKYE